MKENTIENIIKLLNKLIKQDQNLIYLDLANEGDYVKEISDYRFVIQLLQNEDVYKSYVNLYRLEED